MKSVENDPLEELEVRIQNMRTVIEAAEMELWVLLREQEKLTNRNPIGFIINQWDGKKTSRNQRK